MKVDLYSFAFRGLLAEESLDKAGRQRYTPDSQYYSEELAKKLFLNEIDEKYVQQSKSMIIVFTAISAFENATREFVYSVLLETYKHEWWVKGIQTSIREKADKRKETESRVKWHVNRGDAMMSYLEFGDLTKIICSTINWQLFEPYFAFSNSQEWVRTIFDDIEKSRNVIMHSGVLDDFDISRVGMSIRDWLHQINA
ncbi:MAG: hypothetical protein HGB31_08380 [Erysipelotrichaceae bacterium]|nr:hypothetical protein [Erysipelotrichaceae bacterium]